MKAVIINKFGDLEGSIVKTDLDIPRPLEKEVLIKVKAAGVNRPDILQRQGLDPSMYESIRREEIRSNLFFSSIMTITKVLNISSICPKKDILFLLKIKVAKSKL